VALVPLERLKAAISGPDADSIAWSHSPSDIVEGVEVVFATLTEEDEKEQDAVEKMWDAVEKIAELAGEAYAWPIEIGAAAIFAEFAAIGAGYAEASEELKKKRAPIGFCHGVAMGVSEAKPPFIKARFWEANPEPNDFYPEGGKVAQNYYNAGLALGYDYGRELVPGGLDKVFFKEIEQNKPNFQPSAKILAGDTESWSDTDWWDYYNYLGSSFYRMHIAN
jgi:hypothetical protein